jgi:hypothetical protein
MQADNVVHLWTILDLHGDDKKLTMHDLSARAVSALKNLRLFETWAPEVVLIETQRGGKFGNATMVSMSHVIHAFCLTAAAYLGVTVPVVFMSPTAKVTAAVGVLPPEQLAKPSTVSKDATERQRNYAFYKANKQVSVKAVLHLIPQFTLPPNNFATIKKKDDLADTFMQAYAYLHPPPPSPKKRKIST